MLILNPVNLAFLILVVSITWPWHAVRAADDVHPIQRLGAIYTPEKTTFSIWSPDTGDVQLRLEGQAIPMVRQPNMGGYTDIYAVTVPGNHHLQHYTYRINGQTARDPYGTMVDPATDENVIINLGLTEPDGGWIAQPTLAQRTDAVIYETHVRDFTTDPDLGIAPERRGRFLGMVQRGTSFLGKPTGLDHLVRLGVTHVQIMPIFDFYTCSAADPGSERSRCYNWGYDPDSYNVPEAAYARSATDFVGRIRELKTMINEFHRAGIRVIMDVVYNHVPVVHDGQDRIFGAITSRYFLPHDLSGAGRTLNGSEPMVSRMIRDSLEFWVDQYHVDGFRFDLMGVFDYRTVGDWASYLNQRFPDSSLLIYGEPWNGVGDLNDPKTQSRIRLGTVALVSDAHVGVFNSKFREAIRGSNDTGDPGGYAFNQGALQPVIQGSRGAIRFSREFSQPLPDLWDPMFAAAPEQSINYVGAHDNLALYDRILSWAEKANRLDGPDYDYMVRIQEFALSIVLTSQGIPFISGGDEMLRSKLGDRNSYSAPSMINMIRWDWLTDNGDVVDFVRDVIRLRRSHPAFRLNSWDAVNQNIKTTTLGDKVIVNRINGAAVGDPWHDIVVIYNSGNSFDFVLEPGTWHVGLEHSASHEGIDREVSDRVTAEGTAVTIIYR